MGEEVVRGDLPSESNWVISSAYNTRTGKVAVIIEVDGRQVAVMPPSDARAVANLILDAAAKAETDG